MTEGEKETVRDYLVLEISGVPIVFQNYFLSSFMSEDTLF